MSFIFCPLYKLILNDDIKNRILNKIKELQSHSGWNTFDLHINTAHIDTSSINIVDIIKQRNIWKNIAKLSIDLWRDFDYYKKFIFKSEFYDDDEYMKRLESLGCVCEEGVWRSVSRPSEEVVQTSVFVYCLYEMMVKEKIGDIDTVIDNKPIRCVFCDSEIGDSEDNCNICGATKEEREDHQKNIDNEQNKQIHNKEDNKFKINKDEEDVGLIKNNEDCLVDKEYCEVKSKEVRLVNVEDKSSQTVAIFKDVSLQTFGYVEDKLSQTIVNINNEDDKNENLIKKMFEDGINEMKEAKYNYNNILNKINNQEDNQVTVEIHEEMNSKVGKEFDEESVNKILRKVDEDKTWSCTACALKNSFNNDQCEACGMNNVNSIKRNICDKCGTLKNRNDKDCNVCTKRIKYYKAKIEKDRWKCGKCANVHLYSTAVCNGCNGSRIVNGLWMCSQCLLINKWKNSKCEVCNAPNIPPSDKNTNNIQKNRGASREFNYSDKSDNSNIKNKWMCTFSNCNEWNMANNSYCVKCKVWRHASRVRGDPVKTLCNGREISVWICNKCSKHNEHDKLICECREPRYKKRFCKGCNTYNYGTSKKCEKCHQ